MAYYRLEPWGPERDDLRMAIGTANLMNMWTAKGHRVKPSDLLYWDRRSKPQDANQMYGILAAIGRKTSG